MFFPLAGKLLGIEDIVGVVGPSVSTDYYMLLTLFTFS